MPPMKDLVVILSAFLGAACAAGAAMTPLWRWVEDTRYEQNFWLAALLSMALVVACFKAALLVLDWYRRQ